MFDELIDAIKKRKLGIITPDDEETEVEVNNKVENATPKLPEGADLKDVVKAVTNLLAQNSELYNTVQELKKLIPAKKKDDSLTLETFRGLFLHGQPTALSFASAFGLVPPGIALVTLADFFKDETKWEIVDPTKLESFSRLRENEWEERKITHTTITLGKETYTAPIANELWIRNKDTDDKFIISYEPQGPSIAVKIDGHVHERDAVVDLTLDIKKAVMTSKHLRGSLLEITEGSDYRIVDIGKDHPMPIIDSKLLDEIKMNVVSLFEKAEQFQKYNLGLARSIVLEGPPGCGKTMVARYLASQMAGKVTTVWVTAKSISGPSDVAEVFDIARRLSPALVVMEDLDLISGTREMFMRDGSGALGEMLNQLDGLRPNDQIVLLASTNRLLSLDEALRDRPGRFDRIYQVGKPSPEAAKAIARDYLLKHGLNSEEVARLQLSSVVGDYTGAQVVEIVKGAIFEAIHRGTPLNDQCIKKSKDGLEEQRKLFGTNK